MYQLSAQVRDTGDTAQVLTSSPVTYTVLPTLAAVTLTPSPTVQVINNPVTLTATPTCGLHVEYKFELKPSTGTIYSQLQGWGSSNTTTWTPTTPGGYYLRISAREQGTTAVIIKTITYSVANPLLAVILKVSLLSAQPINTAITLTAAKTGGAQVQYQFETSTGGATWTVLRPWGTANTAPWTPNAPASYRLRVQAREGATGTPLLSGVVTYLITPVPPTTVSLVVSPTSPRPVNTPITLTATATGGTKVLYQFEVRASTEATYTVLRAYSGYRTCTWTPTIAGGYYLRVTAREQGLKKGVVTTITYRISL